MKTKIFRSTTVLLIAAVLITFLTSAVIMYNRTLDNMRQNVKNEAQYLKSAAEIQGKRFLTVEGVQSGIYRVTLIDADGTVAYDSERKAADMENHSDRPEFQDARSTGTGEVTRLSATLGESTFYYATALTDGSVLRVAGTTQSIFASLASGFTLIILIMILVVVFGMFYMNHQIKKLVEPINRINPEKPLEKEVYEELTPLVKKLDTQNQMIQDQMDRIRQDHEEYLTITENMKDGMIITNAEVVLGINKTAMDLFEVNAGECLHKSILTVSRREGLRNAWASAIDGVEKEDIMEVRGRTLQIIATPVSMQEGHHGAVIMLSDVTEKLQAEQMRREFSANVSHELKTPLMSISGYAELMKNKMVKSTDIPEFAQRIYDEANRLTALVEDIIRLSQLDENGEQMMPEAVDLLSITKDVVTALDPAAEKRGIAISISGGSMPYQGVHRVLYEMFYNLCDNAIKYNEEKGSIAIMLERSENDIVWSIQDTGIGIRREDQQRVFERFYRVDKSHSRATGGTGLGLSIVKHGVLLHDGKIHVDSEIGKGTRIELRFPAEKEANVA